MQKTERLVKGHPLASAGAMLGTGVVVGVVAQRVLRHRPTVRETVLGALRSETARQVAATRRSLRRVLR